MRYRVSPRSLLQQTQLTLPAKFGQNLHASYVYSTLTTSQIH